MPYVRVPSFEGGIEVTCYDELMPGRGSQDDLLQLVPRGTAQGPVGGRAEVRPPDMLVQSYKADLPVAPSMCGLHL